MTSKNNGQSACFKKKKTFEPDVEIFTRKIQMRFRKRLKQRRESRSAYTSNEVDHKYFEARTSCIDREYALHLDESPSHHLDD